MKNVFKKAALLFLLCCAASLSSCDSILFTGYQGPRGEKGDKGDPGGFASSAGTAVPPGAEAPSGAKPAGAEISPAWAVRLISRDRHEFTIEDNAAPAYDTGQGVEYSAALTGKRSAAAPGQGWIEGSGGEVTFEGLTPDTDYYVWARTKDSASYGAGPARADVGGMVTTKPLREDPFAFASLSGERNAMYYLEPDPVDPDRKVQLSSPKTTLVVPAADHALPPYASHVGGFPFTQYPMVYESKIELSFPLSGLISASPTAASASGYCGVLLSPDWYKYSVSSEHFYEGDLRNAPSTIPFSGRSVTLSAKANDYTANAYPAPEPFSGYDGSLELPLSRPYSSALRVNRDATFSVPVSKAELESLVSLSDYPVVISGPQALGYNSPSLKVGTNLLATATVNERHKLSSLGYYQYLTLAVEYPPDVSVFNVAASPIVESFYHDADTNTVHVVFKDYGSPYAGTVLTYTLVTEGGKQKLATLEIK